MTTTPLFFMAELPPGARVLLTGDEGRHAARVRRMRAGEQVQLGDGRGAVLDCRIDDVRADGLLLEVRRRRSVPRREPRLVVVQALAKGDRGDLAVETMTELGVDEIVPWSAQRSVVEWIGAKAERGVERWRRIAFEAAKQSRRPWVPEVAGLARTADVCERLRLGTGLVLHEGASAPLADYLLPRSGELVLVVGPEGGVSPEELETFTAAGSRPVRLGTPVLRTSTAGPAALAALSVRLGRWS